MDRTVRTVPLLWQEWTIGLNGNPSITSLESAQGTKWRAGEANRKFFSERKVITDTVKRLMDVEKMSEREAVRAVEDMRAGRSFYLLIKDLKQNRQRAASSAAQGADDEEPMAGPSTNPLTKRVRR